MPQRPKSLLGDLVKFVDSTSGLSWENGREFDVIKIIQSVDGRIFSFCATDLSEVLERTDSDGKNFIQVNFRDGNKVLFTDTLVGFKPSQILGLDLTKIPKVVTTPDLMSVLEAIEDCLSSEIANAHELEILKKVYVSILNGGESVGFELATERNWLLRLPPSVYKASA